MAIDSNQLSIRFLFEQNHTFEVPKYQRGYAWEDETIDDFIEDISKCLRARSTNGSRSHFFGGVVTARKAIPNSSRSNFEVIDGQQRLASFVMLVAAINQCIQHLVGDLAKKETLNAEEEKAKAFLEKTIETLYDTYLVYRDEIELEYVEIAKLTLSKADDDFFQSVLSGQAVDPKRASHERIQTAWDRLVRFVEYDVLDGTTPSEKAKQLQILVNSVLISDCSVIFMCSDTRSEAYQIFQVLNDRGVHLTDGDMLRASTMEMLDQKALSAIQNRVADSWDKVLAYPPGDIDSYLGWYFSSWEGRRPRSSNLADQFLEHRFKHKGGATAIDIEKAEEILAEVNRLDHEFTVLCTLSDGDWPFVDNGEVTRWDRERLRMLVTHLKHTNALPLLLSLRRLGAKKFAEAVASIERFVFRYKTVGNVHIGRMTELYLKHAKRIRETKKYSTKSLRADLVSLAVEAVPNSVFEAKLYELQYSPRGGNGHIRYLLITLEDYAEWYSGGANGMPKCKDKKRVFDFLNTTLEHVYPRSAEEKEKDSTLEAVKDTLGNLTIVGPEYNRKLANRKFAEKKPMLAESDLKLNRGIAENDDWTVGDVKERAKSLVEMALRVFVP